MTRVALPVLMRTLARLRPQQVFMRPYAKVAPRVLRRSGARFAVTPDAAERLEAWSRIVSPWSRDSAIEEAERALRGEWEYVGIVVKSSASADLPALPTEFPNRLWAYEFHYRRWLEGLAHLVVERRISRHQLVDMWRRLDDVSGSASGAWDPYVIARRVWSEAIAAALIEPMPELVGRIAHEAAVLKRQPELHLYGNHLLADRAAVAAMSLLLHRSAALTNAAVAAYRFELDRQIDDDGLHEERSPSYHLLALFDLNRTIAAMEVAGFPREIFDAHQRRMLYAAELLLHPDGTLPMFHDGVAEVRPSVGELGIEPLPGSGGYDLRASGLCGWHGKVQGAAMHLACDFGAPRPAHQPGHQHAAPFAFELWWDGLWISSAGISTYEADERRLLERGVAAHAGLRIDGRDPAEIWSAFRMGRGFSVGRRRYSGSSGSFAITAAHDGYAPLVHQRTIRLERTSGAIEITDELSGSGEHLVERFIPVAPGVGVTAVDRSAELRRAGRALRLSADVPWEVAAFDVARKFGVREPSSCLIARERIALPAKRTMRIELLS